MKKNSKKKNRHSSKLGLPPGSLVHVGKTYEETSTITCFRYNQKEYKEVQVSSLNEAFDLINEEHVTWINITGIQDVSLVKEIGKRLDLHPLVMEDILHTDQRPKIEEYDKYFFLVLKMFQYEDANKSIEKEQLSLLVGKNFVISLQERRSNIFNRITERIRNNEGRVRKMGADYLAYALMDIIVDNYFLICEYFADNLEESEDELLNRFRTEILHALYHLKREIISLRKVAWPLREVIRRLEQESSALIRKETRPYLRDLYTHIVQVIDLIETSRDILTGIFDLYLSIASNRMNEIMKVLTIIATIFIPLTFVAGVYGMNFEFMPELEIKLAYPVVLVLMAAIAGIMLLFFRRKKWL